MSALLQSPVSHVGKENSVFRDDPESFWPHIASLQVERTDGHTGETDQGEKWERQVTSLQPSEEVHRDTPLRPQGRMCHNEL